MVEHVTVADKVVQYITTSSSMHVRFGVHRFLVYSCVTQGTFCKESLQKLASVRFLQYFKYLAGELSIFLRQRSWWSQLSKRARIASQRSGAAVHPEQGWF